MLNFATIFDSNYLSRGLAMYNSLVMFCPSAKLFIICLDDSLFTYLILKNHPNITPISLKDVEIKYEELGLIKQSRSYVEYIFTLSPFIALYILEKFPEINLITTLDADILFFSDPSVLFNDIESFSIAITPHRFNKYINFLEKYGKYNVSFQSFKNDNIGISCLTKWKSDCINWCFDRYENERFADQKYLDEWPTLYSSLKEFPYGAGVAPWNIRDKDVSLDDNGQILFKNESLVYFHFHGLRNIYSDMYSLGLYEYGVIRRKKIIKYIYLNYIEYLSKVKNDFPQNQIIRGMHSGLGRFIFTFFLADLYYYRKRQLMHIYNMNIFRSIFIYFKKSFNICLK